ncbi:MAG: WD40 repeat domain-containing protein, partial [Anaerolineales bacterium]
MTRTGKLSSRANQNAEEAQVNLQQALTAEALAVDEQLRANDERDRADEERDNALAAQGLAQSRELAMAAVNELDVDPERSALLAIQSLSISFTVEAQEALHQAVQNMRIVQRFEGHADSVYSIAYNGDGSRLVTASSDGTAKIWDTASGKMLFSISSGGAEFNIVCYHPDGQVIATGDSAGSIKLWDAETGEQLEAFPLSMVRGEEGQLVEGIGDEIEVTAVVFSPDGNQLFGGNFGGTIMAWDLDSGDEILLSEKPQLTGLAVHPDGVHLAVSNGVYPGFVSMLEMSSGEQLLAIEAGNLVSNLAFSPDGNTLVTTDIDGNLIVWDPFSGEILASKTINGELYSPAFSPDGGLLAVAHPNGTAIVLNAETLEELFVLRGHTASVNSVAFSPDGAHVATTSTDGTAIEWTLKPGYELMTISANDYLLRVAYHPDGERLATTSYTGNVSVWDAKNGSLIWQQHGHDEFVGGLAYSSDGALLATSSDVPPVIIIWDAATGEQLLTIEGHTDFVNNIAFSPDGQYIASASEDNTVRVWDLQGREVMSIAHPSAVRGIAFHPNGKFLTTSPWN